jgi:siroheme synthase-like protein
MTDKTYHTDMPPPAQPPAGGNNTLFPIFLKLDQLNTLVVGGRQKALERITAVLRNSPAAKVTLVAPDICSEIYTLAHTYPQVVLLQRSFDPADLQGKQMVIGATDDPALHREIADLARASGILVNVTDSPALSDFYLSAIVQKGDLKVAISSDGHSPTMAQRLKETLSEALPVELDDLLQNMGAIRYLLGGDFMEKLKIINTITTSLAIGEETLTSVIPNQNLQKIRDRRWRRIATLALAAFGLSLIFHIISFYVPMHTWGEFVASVPESFWIFAATGFVAQLADGMLGMGYGITTQICLMSAGVPLAAVSSSIHTAEVFSAGASGLSHYRFGNVNKRLFRGLLWPGVAGAILGSALLAWLGDTYADYIKPLLACYTLLLGLRILSRAFVRRTKRRKIRNLGWLAAAGGFLDSFGGGGWGPLVTSTLISSGKTPQYVIGSVSLSEFFITFASAITFFSLIGISHWPIIAGLLTGGILAAPLGARLAGKLPARFMFLAIGITIIFWSVRILVKLL